MQLNTCKLDLKRGIWGKSGLSIMVFVGVQLGTIHLISATKSPSEANRNVGAFHDLVLALRPARLFCSPTWPGARQHDQHDRHVALEKAAEDSRSAGPSTSRNRLLTQEPETKNPIDREPFARMAIRKLPWREWPSGKSRTRGGGPSGLY